MASIAIHVVKNTTDSQPPARRIIEEATQTFLYGVPVQSEAVGGSIKEWNGVTVADAIAGFSEETGANLTTRGIAETLTYGKVQNQSAAVNIPLGARMNDGKTIFSTAALESIFMGQINPSGQSLLASDIGKNYDMTKDSDNHWYVDKTKTGGAAVVRIVGRDVNEDNLTDANRRTCFFRVLASAAQLL